MWARFFSIRQYVRQSLWVLPLVGGLVGVGLAQADLWLETRLTLPSGWTYSQATASTLLSAVAGAMVGLLGFVVTIGVLVVQMATGTLSPRFMRIWYRDRLQKLVLAAFVATFTFSFGLLRRVESGTVPDLGVSLAGVAVAVDLLLLLLYLDRFVHTLRPVAVSAAMARAGASVVRGMHPHQPSPAALAEARALAAGAPSRRVLAARHGAVQALNLRGLVRVATRSDLRCVIPCTVGDFVNPGGVLVEVHGEPTPGDERRLRGMFALGMERTIDQDPAFALRVMVDVAIRALSPAVNDPTTASQVLGHIGALLLEVGHAEPPGREVRSDAEGNLRLTFPTRTWSDYLDLGVTEIRRYGRSSVQTSRRLRAMLQDLRAEVAPDCRHAIDQQLVALDKAVTETIADPDDRALALGGDTQGIGGATAPPSETLSIPGTGDAG